MMEHLGTDIVRFLHIFSAILTLGGIAYLNFALLPSIDLIAEAERENFLKAVTKRFTRVVHVSIMLLIVTGAWQWVANHDYYEKKNPLAQALIGTKVLIALVMFVLVFVQAFGVVSPRKAIKINLVLGILVVLLAAVVRGTRLAAMEM